MTAPSQPPDNDHATLFVLRLGQALHASGHPAHSLEDILSHVCSQLGLIGQFFTTPTAIMAGFGPLDQQRTFLIRVQPGELNLGRLAALDEIARQVGSGALSPNEGSLGVAQVVTRKPTYPWWLRVAGYGIVSAAGCQFLGGGATDVVVGIGVGVMIGLLGLLFRRYTISAHIFELTASFVASVMVTLLAASGWRLSVPTTTLAGLITILPGLTVTAGMTELASRHLSSGSARLSAAFIVFAAMTFGVALGNSTVNEIYGVTVRSMHSAPLPWFSQYVALAVAPFGFSLLLRARPRDIPLIFMVSLLGYVSFQFGAAHLGQVLGASIGALAVGVAGNVAERLKFAPSSVAQVPGVLLLVPGSIGYRSLTLLLNQNFDTGLSAGVTMVLTAFGLAGGLIIANVLVPPTK